MQTLPPPPYQGRTRLKTSSKSLAEALPDLLIYEAPPTQEQFDEWLAGRPPGEIISVGFAGFRGELDALSKRKNAIYDGFRRANVSLDALTADAELILSNLQNKQPFSHPHEVGNPRVFNPLSEKQAHKFLDELEKEFSAWVGERDEHRESMAKHAEDMRAGRIPYPSTRTEEPSMFKLRLGPTLLGKKGRR
jgi:hypothetical protein